MAWYDTLGKFAKSTWNFTGIPGLFHDISNSLSNNDPWYVDAINTTKDIANIATMPVRGAVKGVLGVGQASYEVGGKARQAIEQGILDTPLMYNKFKNEGESFDQYKQRVAANKDQISLGQATLSLLSPGKNAGPRSGWLQDWEDAHLKFLANGFDLFNAEHRQAAFQDQTLGKWVSGATDLVDSTVIDPLTFTGFLGKGAAIAAKGTMLSEVRGPVTRAVFGKVAMTPEKFMGVLNDGLKGSGAGVKDINFLAESDAKTQYEYWVKKKVTNPDAMAEIFGRAQTPEHVVDTFKAVMLQDKKAMAAVFERDPVTGLVLDQAFSDVPHAQRLKIQGKLDSDTITAEHAPDYIKAVSTYVADLAQTDERYAAALKSTMTGGELKYGVERGPLAGRTAAKALKAAQETFGEPTVSFFQKSSLHPLVKVTNYFTKEVPSGKFSVNDADSYKEFNAFLREANQLSKGTFSPRAAEYADRYLTASDPGERFNIILQAEKEAMSHLFPGWSEDEINKIYAIYDSRRAKAIADMKNQGFISTLEGDRVVHNIDLPILNREAANFVVTADLRKLKTAIDAHQEVLPGILQGVDVEAGKLRFRNTVAGLDTINDIFKTSVLLRLGYTIRNLAEAQLSMAAKGFALPALAATGGKASVERFFKNRKVNFNRLLDNVSVLAGRKTSLGAQQLEMARIADGIQAEEKAVNMGIREIYNRVRELNQNPGKIVDDYIAAEKAKGNLVGREEATQLALSQYYRAIAPALSELESATLYHGSAADTFALDKARPLSLSATKSAADRYATPEFDVAVENYLQARGEIPALRAHLNEPMYKRAAQDMYDIFTKVKEDGTLDVNISAADLYGHMPHDEFEAVNALARGNYSLINEWLWRENNAATFPKDTSQRLEKIASAINRSKLPADMTLYRGMTSDIYFNAKPGQVVSDKGLISTSKESYVALRRLATADKNPVVLEIKAPKNFNGLDINALHDAAAGYNYKKPVRIIAAEYSREMNKLERQLEKATKANNDKRMQELLLKIDDLKGNTPMFNQPQYAPPSPFAFEQEVLLGQNITFKVVKVEDTYENIPSHLQEVFKDGYRKVTLEPVVAPKPRVTLSPEVLADINKMKSDMIAATRAGNTVLVRKGRDKTFHAVSEDDIRDYNPMELRRGVFKVRPNTGNVTTHQSYGKELDLTVQSNLNQFKDNTDWQDPNNPVFQFMRDNGYGRIKVRDAKKANGVSHVALPEYLGANGQKKHIEDIVRNLMEYKEVEPVEVATKDVSRAENRMLNRAAERVRRVGYKDRPVSPYYTEDSINAMLNNGIDDFATTMKQRLAASYAHFDDMATRLNATVTRAETNSVKHRLGFGTQTIDVNGHAYELPKAFEGASWFLGRTSAEPTWNAMVGSQEMAFLTGMGSRSVRLVKSSDPRYFEGWANILNMHFRDPETGVMDPVVRQILDGANDNQILNWFKTKEGMHYANDTYTQVGNGISFTKLKGGDLDEHLLEKINTVRGSVKLYIPDAETALMLSAAKEDGKPLSGGEVQNFLRNRFGKKADLPDLNGLLVTTSKEYRDQERIIDTVNRRVMRFLGSLPEDVFARHPLASAVYDRHLKLSIANFAAAKGTERLTADELNNIVRGAREASRQEVERTLFTIVRRSGASSSTIMRIMFPFYAAYENTAKRWAGFAADDPSIITRASRSIAQIVNGQQVVDNNGNRITDASQLQGGANANLVVQVPQAFINSLPAGFREVANNAFKQIQIPLNSLDVITQGQPGNPGFGPFAVLPAYMILKNRPELESAFKPFFPAGQPQSGLDLFAPSVLRRLRSMWTQDALYVRTYDQMLRYETYNFNTGQRTTAPTAEEIQDKTNKFFLLRALTSVTMPVAISPEADFYAQQYRKFQEQYPDRLDPTTGKWIRGEADARFLEVYPDFFGATVSLSKNIGGLEPSLGTVANLRKFSNLMAYAEGKGDPELMGFLANDGDNQYTFSQAAYQWQYSHGAYPGSKNTYRQNRAPGELVRDANIKQGWTMYGDLMDQIEVYKTQNGIVSDKDPQMALLNKAKQIWVQQMRDTNADWYAAYISPDRGKYMRRADILKQALNDEKWMKQNGNRPVIKSVALYMQARDQIGQMLLDRKRAGGSSSLDANSNGDIAFVFEKLRTQLSLESPEFSQFLNRYFPNDPVVV